MKTGISQREYRDAAKSDKDIDWCCQYCANTGDRQNEVSTSLAMPVAISLRTGKVRVTGWFWLVA